MEKANLRDSFPYAVRNSLRRLLQNSLGVSSRDLLADLVWKPLGNSLGDSLRNSLRASIWNSLLIGSFEWKK